MPLTHVECTSTDAVDVVRLNTAPISVTSRVLGTRQVLLDRDPDVRHRYESATARLFQDLPPQDA